MTAAPYLLAQLSDPHLRDGADGDMAAGGLAAGVARVLALDPPVDAVLVSGDLLDDSETQHYPRVRELLAPLPMPVHVLPGNHDDRAGMRAHFDLPGEGDELIQYAVRLGPLRLVCCDTILSGRGDGAYDADRRAWLADTLAAEPDTPTIVALHHPPIDIGVPGLDALGIPAEDRRGLAELLAAAPQVRRVVCGHVHLAVAGSLGGRPVFTSPSTYLQARLDMRPGELDIELLPDPPGFLLHAWLGDELASHVVPIG